MKWGELGLGVMHPPKTSKNDTLDAHENGVDPAFMKNELISQSHD
jgi:hypothetical protein